MTRKPETTAVAPEPRQHVTIKLGGEEYTLQPSVAAVLAIEAATGKSVYQLGRAASESAMPAQDVAVVTTELIRAWGKASDDKAVANFNTDRIGHLVYEHGMAGAQLRLAVVLGYAVSGGYDAAGNVKEQPAAKSAV